MRIETGTAEGGVAAMARLKSEQREIKADLGDVRRELKEARAQEKALGEAVDIYGDRAKRPALAAARESITALEARIPELEAAELALIEQMAPHSRHDALVIGLQTAHTLTNEQREQLRAELEAGHSRKAVEQRAAALAAQNATAAGQAVSYAFNAPDGVPW